MRFNDYNFLFVFLVVIFFEIFEYIYSCVFSKIEYVELIECLEELIKGGILILTGMFYKL